MFYSNALKTCLSIGATNHVSFQSIGPENNYGYAFNTGPVEMRYGGYPAQQQQPEVQYSYDI